MDNTSNNPVLKKKQSDILTSFKQASNPYYSSTYGFAINQVSYWEKYFEQFAVLAYIGGHKHLFVGDDAKNFLYNVGDRDHSKFAGISEERRQQIVAEITGQPATTPAAPTEPTPVVEQAE